MAPVLTPVITALGQVASPTSKSRLFHRQIASCDWELPLSWVIPLVSSTSLPFAPLVHRDSRGDWLIVCFHCLPHVACPPAFGARIESFHHSALSAVCCSGFSILCLGQNKLHLSSSILREKKRVKAKMAEPNYT